MLAKEENFAGLARLNREMIGRAEALGRHTGRCWTWTRPVYEKQEQSAYNGHFESNCFDPLLLFNHEGDCLAAKLRPGNVHSADGWEELLLAEIERQQRMGKEITFRADAAFKQHPTPGPGGIVITDVESPNQL